MTHPPPRFNLLPLTATRMNRERGGEKGDISPRHSTHCLLHKDVIAKSAKVACQLKHILESTGQLEQVTSGREASDKMLLVIMRPFLLP